MYAVILDKSLLYLGESYSMSVITLQKNENSVRYDDVTLNQLSELLGFSETEEQPEPEPEPEESLSQTIQNLIKKLEELGINQEFKSRIQENSSKVLADVKFLGLRGMKTVGEGFVSLGDLMRKAGEPNTEGGQNVKPDC